MRIADDVTSWGNFPLKIGSAWAERVGRGEVGGFTRRVKVAPAKPWAACGAHPLGDERATCHVFSMQETVLSPCSASKVRVHGCFLCQSALTLSERKLARKWVWLDSRITANILAMPGPVAVCILEPQDMRYGTCMSKSFWGRNSELGRLIQPLKG